ncbi:MAG TPA: ABC-type transport auxiliary lipoprotein family protein [Rhizomicrobium sp.]|jgi:cholesterol transport system auxiliary component
MIAQSTLPALDRRHLLLGATTLVFLAGCGGGNLLGPGPDPQLYMLKPTFGPVDGPTVSWALNIAAPTSADSLNTSRIALFNPPARLDYYANAAWPDQLPSLVQSTLVQAFEQSGKIASVASDEAGLRSDYMLQTEIRDFNAVYDTPDTAPKVKVRIMVKLVQTHARDIVQTLEVEQEVAAGANSVDNVVIAAGQALTAALRQIVEWALKAPPLPQPPSGS